MNNTEQNLIKKMVFEPGNSPYDFALKSFVANASPTYMKPLTVWVPEYMKNNSFHDIQTYYNNRDSDTAILVEEFKPANEDEIQDYMQLRFFYTGMYQTEKISFMECLSETRFAPAYVTDDYLEDVLDACYYIDDIKTFKNYLDASRLEPISVFRLLNQKINSEDEFKNVLLKIDTLNQVLDNPKWATELLAKSTGNLEQFKLFLPHTDLNPHWILQSHLDREQIYNYSAMDKSLFVIAMQNQAFDTVQFLMSDEALEYGLKEKANPNEEIQRILSYAITHIDKSPKIMEFILQNPEFDTRTKNNEIVNILVKSHNKELINLWFENPMNAKNIDEVFNTIKNPIDKDWINKLYLNYKLEKDLSFSEDFKKQHKI